MNRLRAWHLALLLAPAIYLVNLGALPLQLPDEPREAGVALEMWHHGPIAAPRVNGELHVVKPPVMYWAASVFLALSGEKSPSELAIRLAPALFSIGSLLLVLLFGKLWFSFRHGALAACALALSPEMISHGRRFMSDPALAFFVTGCVGFALTTLR
ncbi:MAG: ArnT family glycosyltransferase, partial [Planctomycetota bacterium]